MVVTLIITKHLACQISILSLLGADNERPVHRSFDRKALKIDELEKIRPSRTLRRPMVF